LDIQPHSALLPIANAAEAFFFQLAFNPLDFGSWYSLSLREAREAADKAIHLAGSPHPAKPGSR